MTNDDVLAAYNLRGKLHGSPNWSRRGTVIVLAITAMFTLPGVAVSARPVWSTAKAEFVLHGDQLRVPARFHFGDRCDPATACRYGSTMEVWTARCRGRGRGRFVGFDRRYSRFRCYVRGDVSGATCGHYPNGEPWCRSFHTMCGLDQDRDGAPCGLVIDIAVSGRLSYRYRVVAKDR